MFSKPSKARQSASSPSQPMMAQKRGAGAKGAPFSIIAQGVVIEGNIRAEADLHIDGSVEGDIRCAELVQGEASLIKGRIEATSVRLAGQVEGSIEAEQLVIEASARISGDCTYSSISIAPGAHVEGRFNHGSGQQITDASPPGADIRLVANETSPA